MARPKLSPRDRPWAVRILLRTCEVLGSLKLAVLLIAAAALVLGWATFVESDYGTPAVHFGIYDARWFAVLNVLLAINVVSAAAIRFPWKRYQTGFVITHAGILVLLVGTLMSRVGGIDAQLPIFEGQSEHLAYRDTQHFELSVYSLRPGRGASSSPGDHHGTESLAPADIRAERTVEIPFVAGPFNWADYAKLRWFPWHLSHRDRGVLYDKDGIKLEVLDYLSNSTYGDAVPLKLKVKSKPATEVKSDDDQRAVWQQIELGVRRRDDPHGTHGAMGLGSREKLPGGQRIVFWTADSRPATEAFLQSRPEGPLGNKGMVVVYAFGKKHQLAVDKLLAQKTMPIGDTGLALEVGTFDEPFLGLVLTVRCPGEPRRRMVLFGDVPEFNRQDEEHGIYGTYWVDVEKLPKAESGTAEVKAMREASRQPRIDILEGIDGKLYYRTWTSPEFGAVGELPIDGKVVTLECGGEPTALAVEQFVPSDTPGRRVLPGRFLKQARGQQIRQALVRLTVDGQSEEFWLEGLSTDPRPQLQTDQRRVVVGNRRRVAITLPRDRIDVGFGLYLHKFERKLDPGSSQPSWYASLVDMVDRDHPHKKIEQRVLITLNEPVNFTDPANGRSYRVYQESFAGPFKPGDPIFDSIVGGQSQRDELFLSWLTFNYDPGRGLKYLGCLLIVVGISTLFYMRAYFFRRREGAAEEVD